MVFANHMKKNIALAALLLSACVSVPEQPLAGTSSDIAEPYVHIKRASLWVPDLDRAILFYRDVLGFKVHSQGELKPKKNSVLIDLFNIDPSSNIRRALFSSSTAERALFVMESIDAPEYAVRDKRSSIQVIQTDDLLAVESRAKAHGFKIGNSNSDISQATGKELRETTIFGPGGQAVLVYQIIE